MVLDFYGVLTANLLRQLANLAIVEADKYGFNVVVMAPDGGPVNRSYYTNNFFYTFTSDLFTCMLHPVIRERLYFDPDFSHVI